MNVPLPAPGDRWAVFLDLDGTLAELAAHPSDARVLPQQVALLGRLESGLDGALAVVSGRSIDSLDGMLHPLRPRAAGLHGLERRNDSQCTAAAGDALTEASRQLEDLADRHPGLMLENKGAAIALHFRNAPELEAMCRETVHALAAGFPDHHVIAGKMVLELKPRHSNKGTAIDAFLGEPPFRGRTPVFAGDDVTDEDGFETVNARGGISIKIGDGATAARFRLPDVTALHTWLQSLEAQLLAGATGHPAQ